MRVSIETRNVLAEVAETELGGVSLDEALRILLFEHQTRAALACLSAEELQSYTAEAEELAERDVAVAE